MSPRRLGAIALLIFATSATVALAVETESFHGRTEGRFFSHGEYRQARLSFELTGNTLHRIRFEIRVRCPDGQHRSRVGRVLETTRDSDGRFNFDGAVTSSGGFRRAESFSGRIRGNHASGTVRLETKLDANGRESASGTTCRSGTVEWAAHAQ
jgi:hypothetical protein